MALHEFFLRIQCRDPKGLDASTFEWIDWAVSRISSKHAQAYRVDVEYIHDDKASDPK